MNESERANKWSETRYPQPSPSDVLSSKSFYHLNLSKQHLGPSVQKSKRADVDAHIGHCLSSHRMGAEWELGHMTTHSLSTCHTVYPVHLPFMEEPFLVVLRFGPNILWSDWIFPVSSNTNSSRKSAMSPSSHRAVLSPNSWFFLICFPCSCLRRAAPVS